MKKIKYILLIALPLLGVGCSSSFLDTDLNERASQEQINEALKQNPDKLNAFTSGMYKNVFSPEAQKSHDDFGLKGLQLATDMMTDDMAYQATSFFVYDYMLDNRGSNYRRTGSTWQQLYAIINGANQVITLVGDVDKLPADTDEEKSKKAALEDLMGQSYVMRAYSYFWLINMYQQPYEWNKDKIGIPLYTETKTLLNRVPVKDIYAQILADVDKGYGLLKGKSGAKPDVNKINEYAAAAIYAKVLEFVSDYPNQKAEIVKYAKEAIKGGRLMTTEDEFLSGFNSIEMPEVLWGSAIDVESNTFYASFMSHMDAKAPGYGGDGGALKMIASDLYNQIADTDIRKKWFGLDLPTTDPHYDVKQYVQKKFVDVNTLGKGEVFASDYIYIRVAEMYFVAAEALYADGKQAEAKEMLETVMKTRNPQYSVGSKDLLSEIKLQKRVELWGEGTRLLDMKRRNEALDRTKATNHNVSAPMQKDIQDNLFIYRIPDAEVNANDQLGDLNE